MVLFILIYLSLFLSIYNFYIYIIFIYNFNYIYTHTHTLLISSKLGFYIVYSLYSIVYFSIYLFSPSLTYFCVLKHTVIILCRYHDPCIHAACELERRRGGGVEHDGVFLSLTFSVLVTPSFPLIPFYRSVSLRFSIFHALFVTHLLFVLYTLTHNR